MKTRDDTEIYYLHLVSATSEEKSLLSLSISGHCKRFAHDQIYTGEGLYIFRLRNFEECHRVEVHVNFLSRHLRSLSLRSLIPEQCRCPRSMQTVFKGMECPSFNKQIHRDLKPFENLDFRLIKQQIQDRFKNFKSSSLCNYAVKNNKVYRKCYGEYTGFSMFIDSMMSSLTNKVLLPDVEFFINLGDWPVIKKSSPSIPIFSWCGSHETLDIVLPTYDLSESTLQMMHRVSLDIISIQSEQYKWEQKIEKAFFRGRDSRRERLDLIDIYREHPDLFNSSITNFFFFTDEIPKYGPRVKHIPFTDFFEYKYQINIDGTVAAYRLPYLLAGNSAVLKQDSPYYEHYYHDLRPFEHFVPFHRDPKLDLVAKVKWLKENDQKAQEIARNARKYVRNSNLFLICFLSLNLF